MSVALITGSAQGLGRSIALRLARDGFNIALNDLSSKRDQLRAVEEDIEKMGRKAYLVPADVTIEGEVEGMVRDVSKVLGGLDVMVANAGVARFASLVSTGVDDWEHVMAVNMRGPFLCYKHAAQQMIKQGRGGRIIGASSVAGRTGFRGACAYSASKFGVRGLTQAVAMELGPYNITVNSYAPGLIRTPMAHVIEDLAKVDPVISESITNYLNTRIIGYDGQPEDIASIVSYLASKEAHYITGQCITVDGGSVFS